MNGSRVWSGKAYGILRIYWALLVKHFGGAYPSTAAYIGCSRKLAAMAHGNEEAYGVTGMGSKS